MAAVSSAPVGAAALTPPTSSHDDRLWDFQTNHGQQQHHYETSSAPRSEQTSSHAPVQQNGVFAPLNSQSAVPSGFDNAARRMRSADNLHSTRAGRIRDANGESMPLDWPLTAKQDGTDERLRAQGLGLEYSEEDSKWIHRDKLARIESAELQAAGIYVPRARASSRQRRERGAVDAEQGRQKKDHGPLTEPNTPTVPHWDLRTPEEIAEAEATAYFSSQTSKGGTRIPVAKTSPAPISTDYLERGSPAVRRPNEGTDGDMIAYPKTRSRSASASTQGWDGSKSLKSKRSVTDGSLKKTSPRKSSTSRSAAASGRPQTRSGHARQPSGTRPPTRSGDKAPEGDPPWMMDSYKPDPRLPPDQQLLPTVARRLQQEKWQKEGKGGDAYDKDFRPLNDHEFAKPPEKETASSEEETAQPAGEWPLRPGAAKSPKPSQYSTMPRITDKPPAGPVTSPKIPGVQPFPQNQGVEPMAQATEDVPEKSKGGCGCCVVM